jgi:MSHA biogenesis protein MshL
MFARLLFIAVLAFFVASCALRPMDISDGHAKAEPPVATGTIPPPVQFPAALPKPKPSVKAETYSVVVNNVPASELLFALARDAKLNVDIHSGIRGLVTLNAIDQTLPQLLSRIARQIDMRWELDGANLSVMPDTPYLRLYKIDYLNVERLSQGQIGVSGQVSSGSSSGAGGSSSGSNNSSSAQIQNKSDNKFWHTLVENIKDILHETDKLIPGLPGQPGAQAALAAQAAAQQAAAAQTAAAPGATPAPAAAPIPLAQQGATFREAASVIANPEVGVLSIRATSRQHEKLQEFLDQVLVNAKRQVLIEATIAEVSLNNSYQQGIDWSVLRQGATGSSFTQSATPITTADPSGSFFVFNSINNSFTSSIRLLESFGTVRILSSPKISVINNQSAILKVVDNRVYFTLTGSITPGTLGSAAIASFTTTPNVVAVGFVMNVTPQIASDDTIILNLRPAVTRILKFVNDPNPVLANPCGIGVTNCTTQAILSPVPEIQTREMESIIKVSSGQTAVMGGLIQDGVNYNEDSVPGVNALPGIGALFSQRNHQNTKTELVIFLRTLVIRDASIEGDYRPYRTYLPGQDFLSSPNPGKIVEGGSLRVDGGSLR